MTVGEITKACGFKELCAAEPDREAASVYCGDLLSGVMAGAPEDCAWVTVMGNVNAAAVAFRTNAACIVLAEGREADRDLTAKAREHGINVLGTDLPVFEAALKIYCLIKNKNI